MKVILLIALAVKGSKENLKRRIKKIGVKKRVVKEKSYGRT